MDQTDSPTPGETPQPPPNPTGNGFFGWLRGLRITRSTDDRWFTGVAGGIAARAGIDPLIVRGIFVVLTILGGSGVLIYLAAWLLLPDATGKIQVEEIVQGRASSGITIVACIIGLFIVLPVIIGLFQGLFSVPGDWWAFTLSWAPDWVAVTLTVLWWAVVVPVALIWGVLWLIRRSARQSRDAAAVPGDAPTAPNAAGAAGTAGAGAAGAAGAAGTAGASWSEQTAQATQQVTDWSDKVGAQASNWAERASTQSENWAQKVDAQATEWESKIRTNHAQSKLGATQLLLTLALSLLAAGGTAVWAHNTQPEPLTAWLFSLIAFIVVCSCSMIVAGIRGKNSGWVGFLAFVGVLALLFTPLTSVLPNDTRLVLLGENVVNITDASPREIGVLSLAGNITVDLTALDDADPGRTIDVWMIAGSVDVLLPATHSSQVNVQLIAGNTTEGQIGFDSRTTRGPFQFRTIDTNVADAASADTTEVRIHMIAGNVETFRAEVSDRTRQNTGDNR